MMDYNERGVETWRGEQWRGGLYSWDGDCNILKKPEFKLFLQKLSKNEMLLQK